MAENAPAPAAHGNLAPTFPASAWSGRIQAIVSQPAVKRTLPALATVGGLALAAMLYVSLAGGPSRVLYPNLTDTERGTVAAALEQNGMDYEIDPATGMVKVAEDDLYRARMLIANNGGLAVPAAETDMLDSIPLGASRTLEGERLRLAREHELERTILEINVVEAARVHLAIPERSVFLREAEAPGASVMLRLVRGRNLDHGQVEAVVNLVAGSVPGLSAESVRVVDQDGRLLTAPRSAGDRSDEQIGIQKSLEAKLREQIAQLLAPLLGEGNFSTEVQIELSRDEVTSARESYGDGGVVRQESESRSQRAVAGGPGGIPGVLSNTPPPDAVLSGNPPGQQVAGIAPGEAPSESEESASRTYDVGREVAVVSTRPGGIERLSVAVAVSDKALAAIKPANAERLRKLVEAAVGADSKRGDRVEVLVGRFEPLETVETAFYEQPWFMMVMRQALAIAGALLLFLFAVRPIVGAVRRRIEGSGPVGQRTSGSAGVVDGGTLAAQSRHGPTSLKERVALARRLAVEQPEHAAQALRRMLAPAGDER